MDKKEFKSESSSDEDRISEDSLDSSESSVEEMKD